ncbi:hypothetical protein [Alteribacter aurantiacus]|uniref:hypothetical protein n=1 Tax=Alteribacter aurantiacus TaxID=254410 RepID=UPI000408BEA6|nr:hypothetical protein [Alteribacter aurantiacus]
MREVIGLWHMVWLEMRSSFLYFFAILFGVVSIGIVYTAINQSDQVFFQTNAAVYLYFAIIGSYLYRLVLTYGSSFGATRKQLYIGVVASAVVLSVLGAFIHTVVFLGLEQLTLWQAEEMNLSHFTAFMAGEQTVLIMFAVDMAMLIMIMSLGFAASVIHYRFGLVSLIIGGGVIGLSVIIPEVREAIWLNVFNIFLVRGIWEITGAVLAVAVAGFVLPYFLVGRLNLYFNEKSA